MTGGSSRFNALLGGRRSSFRPDVPFWLMDEYGYYWSSTERDGGYAFFYHFIGALQGLSQNRNKDKTLGFSVRCLKN